MGRPKLSEQERRVRIVSVRLTDEEYRTWANAAKTDRVADWIRRIGNRAAKRAQQQ